MSGEAALRLLLALGDTSDDSEDFHDSDADPEYIPTPCKKKSTVAVVNEPQPGPSQPAPIAVVNEPQHGSSQPAPTAVVNEPQPDPSQPAHTAVVNEPQPGPSQPAPTAVVNEPQPGPGQPAHTAVVNEPQLGPSQPAPTAVVNEPQPGPSQPAPTAVVNESLPGPSQPAPTAVVNEAQPGPSQPALTAVVNEPQPGSRKRKCNPSAWKKNKRKNKRCRGEQYMDTEGNIKPARHPKPVNCANKCRNKCLERISDTRREAICNECWSLANYERQKDYLLHRIKIKTIARERARGERIRNRQKAMEYYFHAEGQEKRVCKQFFLRTLDISEVPMNSALKERSENNSFVGEDKRGKRTPSNKTPEEDLHHVRRHIESFPITESHYTRKDTKRKYLDQKLSIAKMYALYLDHSKNQDPPLKPVGEMTYRRIFCKEYNLSFYPPKKINVLNAHIMPT